MTSPDRLQQLKRTPPKEAFSDHPYPEGVDMAEQKLREATSSTLESLARPNERRRIQRLRKLLAEEFATVALRTGMNTVEPTAEDDSKP